MHAREQRRVDDIPRVGIHNHFLITFNRQRFLGGDETRADVRQLAAHGLGRENTGAIGNRPRQHQRPTMNAPQFIHQRERIEIARVPARTAAHRDQTIDPGLQRFFRVTHFNHVVKHHAAVRVHARRQCRRRRQRGDDNGHLVREHDLHVMVEALVRFVQNEVNRERRHFFGGIVARVLCKLGLDAHEPCVEFFLRTRVQRGK